MESDTLSAPPAPRAVIWVDTAPGLAPEAAAAAAVMRESRPPGQLPLSTVPARMPLAAEESAAERPLRLRDASTVVL